MMSLLSKAGILALTALNPHVLTCRTDYLFILSHMRSRSSVLAHVLGSHPEICGYRELHISYSGKLDLMRLRIVVFHDLRRNLTDKYVLDKLLLNAHTISDEVLSSVRPKIVFLLRDPKSTLKSIINMGHITGVEWYKDPAKAADYYCSRLGFLEELAETVGDGYLYVESSDLVDNTDGVLERLSEWLDLDEPLDKTYSIFSRTGRPGSGDPSHNIQSGILKATSDHRDIEIRPDVLERAEDSYSHCRSRLLKGIGQADRT